jgi:hypothetical protein
MREIPLLKGYLRLGNFPLDKTSVFLSTSDLLDYALTNPSAYNGQLVSLIDPNTEQVKVYKVQKSEDKSSLEAVELLGNVELILDDLSTRVTDLEHGIGYDVLTANEFVINGNVLNEKSAVSYKVLLRKLSELYDNTTFIDDSEITITPSITKHFKEGDTSTEVEVPNIEIKLEHNKDLEVDESEDTSIQGIYSISINEYGHITKANIITPQDLADILSSSTLAEDIIKDNGLVQTLILDSDEVLTLPENCYIKQIYFKIDAIYHGYIS